MAAKMLPVVLVVLLAIEIRGQEYEINVRADGKEIAVIQLSIKGGTANTKVNDVTEHFDLKEQRWQHDEAKRWVTISQCETWAKQSKERSSKSSDSIIPEEIRPFVLWSLDPTFKVEATDTSLALTSGQVDYKIVGETTDGDLRDYFRYARLNAYKKAMTERKLPPFAELRVIDELESRKMMPTSMEIRMPGIPRSPVIEMAISQKSE